MCKWARNSSSDSYTCCRFWTNLQYVSTIDNLCTIIELSKGQWRSTERTEGTISLRTEEHPAQFVLTEVIVIIYRDRVKEKMDYFHKAPGVLRNDLQYKFSCHLCPDDCGSCLRYNSLLAALGYAHTTWRLSWRHPRLPDRTPRTL